jgi:glycosyltransferase involved in cell wall biosynthesis
MKRMAALVPSDVAVVNAHDWPTLRAGALAARRLGVPHIWTRNDDALWERAVVPSRTPRGARTVLSRLMNGTLGLFDLRDVRHAHEVVVLSEFDAGMVRTAYRRPARVIRIGCAEHFYDPPDRAAARARWELSDDQFVVAALALLLPYRRFEDLIDAIALIDDRSVTGLLVGSDSYDPAYADALTARIAARGLGERVRLRRGAISESQLRDLYAAADAYVFPSSRQSYGQAPLEALAAGTPVIVSSGAGVHEILQGRAGVEVVPPADPVRLADAIARSRALPRSRAEPTREWLRSNLNNASYAREFSALIESA